MLPRTIGASLAAMIRDRHRLVPVLLVALLALTVCAASLAHAETERGNLCIGTKAAAESSGLSTPDALAVPLGSVSLVPGDQPVRIPLLDVPRECPGSGVSELRTPRAPPVS